MLKHVSEVHGCCNPSWRAEWLLGATQRQRVPGGDGGDGGDGGGTTGEKGELRSGKVMLADPIRVSHLFIRLGAREDLTQVEPSLQYRMNAYYGREAIKFSSD